MVTIKHFSAAGEKEKFLKTIYDDYYRRMCFYAAKYLHDAEEAKDIVQEIFVRMWERKTDFENDCALSAFLYSSVYHACMNRLAATGIHQRHHNQILRQSDPEDCANYVTDRIEDEVLLEIFAAIDSLPEECRKVFRLSYLEGYEIQKVAEELNISVHTVKSQRARAKKLLQERLKDVFPVLAFFFLS